MHNVAHEKSFLGLAILFRSYVREYLSSVCVCVCVCGVSVVKCVWCGCMRCGKVCTVCDGRGGEVEEEH